MMGGGGGGGGGSTFDADQELTKHMAVIEKVIPQVFLLETQYREAAPADEDAGGDDERARGLTRIFTHLGESYMELVCGAAEVGQDKVVNLVALCSGNRDVEIARITFRFWFRCAQPLRHPRRVSATRASRATRACPSAA